MMIRITRLMICVWLFAACAPEDPVEYTTPMAQEPDTLAPPPTAAVACDTAPAYEELAAFNMCVTCHASTKLGPDRKSAPVSVNFDTEAGALESASLAVKMVMVGAMPPNSTGLKMTDLDKQELYAWAKCNM